jgi:hypothetical protein
MLEYTCEEAKDLLTTKLDTAKSSLKNTLEDLEFLRDQITTMEVSILFLKKLLNHYFFHFIDQNIIPLTSFFFFFFYQLRYCSCLQLGCKAETFEQGKGGSSIIILIVLGYSIKIQKCYSYRLIISKLIAGVFVKNK